MLSIWLMWTCSGVVGAYAVRLLVERRFDADMLLPITLLSMILGPVLPFGWLIDSVRERINLAREKRELRRYKDGNV